MLKLRDEFRIFRTFDGKSHTSVFLYEASRVVRNMEMELQPSHNILFLALFDVLYVVRPK